MSTRVRAEAGMGLVELLIALTIMTIGIFALVAGFSSGIETNRRASKSSTAGTLADQQMEAYRSSSYASIAAVGATKTGADSRTYWLESFVTPARVCGDGSLDSSGTPCGGAPVGREVKTVTIKVHDGSTSAAPVLITATSTFDRSTG
ncbi:MAG: type II secretion system protein [Gaiellaceae bacterium]|nr:type II secretion system protein [Actinomycetota bacterium]